METPAPARRVAPRRSFATIVQTISREPLAHFLAIGLALFAINAWMLRGQVPGVNRQIVLTLDDLRQLDVNFVSQWHRQPTQAEFNGMLEELIRQEVLYREGLAMGLDKDDTIVKRRMAQKIEFLSEDAAAREPGAQELRQWFRENGRRFELPKRAAFRHLFFGFDRRWQNARSDAAATLAKLAGQPENAALAQSVGDPFMYQSEYHDRTPDQLAKEFGPAFAQSLFELKPGSWQGPIESGYGWHLIWIESVIPSRVPRFEEVAADVKIAWLADEKVRHWQSAYAKMRSKYAVLLPKPPDEPATTKTAASRASTP
jgi:hypothetical protein